MGTELPDRKGNRLKGYDHSAQGAYFITVCTRGRAHILSCIHGPSPDAVGRDALIPPQVELTPVGSCLEHAILQTEIAYPNVTVDRYVIMPNHFHLLLTVHSPTAPNGSDGGMRASRPTIPLMVRAIKTNVSRQAGRSIWQDSFYDHIIRTETDYWAIVQYIDENPLKWVLDPLYQEGTP